MTTMLRWRGLKSLVQDAVEHGSRAVERIQKETAARPFAILEMIAPVALPAKGVHVAYDASVSTLHGMIRGVNRAVGATLDVVMDVIEAADQPPASNDDEGTRPSSERSPRDPEP